MSDVKVVIKQEIASISLNEAKRVVIEMDQRDFSEGIVASFMESIRDIPINSRCPLNNMDPCRKLCYLIYPKPLMPDDILKLIEVGVFVREDFTAEQLKILDSIRVGK